MTKRSNKAEMAPIDPMEDLRNKLQNQLEFYLSQENLAFDPFFISKALKHKNRFIKMKHFLRCQKIKKIFGDFDIQTRMERILLIRQAVQNSKLIKLSKSEDLIRPIEAEFLQENQIQQFKAEVFQRSFVVKSNSKIKQEQLISIRDSLRDDVKIRSVQMLRDNIIIFVTKGYQAQVAKKVIQEVCSNELSKGFNLSNYIDYDEENRSNQRQKDLLQSEHKTIQNSVFIRLVFKKDRLKFLSQKIYKIKKLLKNEFSQFGVELLYVGQLDKKTSSILVRMSQESLDNLNDLFQDKKQQKFSQEGFLEKAENLSKQEQLQLIKQGLEDQRKYHKIIKQKSLQNNQQI